jgi:hypothetical protein
MRRLRRRGVSERTLGFATFMGVGRIAFGAAMVLAPRPFLVAMRTPSDQISDSARLLTRMTGMRDVLLGIHVLRSRDERESLRRAALLNAAADSGDAAFLAISTRWPGFFVAGASGVPVAAGAAVSFMLLARSLD